MPRQKRKADGDPAEAKSEPKKQKVSKPIVVLGCKNLHANCTGFAFARGYQVASDFSGLEAGGTGILYTHGRYREVKDGVYEASKEIIIVWKTIHENFKADEFAVFLKDSMHFPQLMNLTLIIHACFSAGAVEKMPTPLDTFASELCVALKDYDGLKVIGYAGRTSEHNAGAPVNFDPPNQRIRSTRTKAQVNPYAHENFEVAYAFDKNQNVVLCKPGPKVQFSNVKKPK